MKKESAQPNTTTVGEKLQAIYNLEMYRTLAMASSIVPILYLIWECAIQVEDPSQTDTTVAYMTALILFIYSGGNALYADLIADDVYQIEQKKLHTILLEELKHLPALLEDLSAKEQQELIKNYIIEKKTALEKEDRN